MALLDVGAVMARAALVRQKCGFFAEDPPYSTHKIIERAFPDVHVGGAALPRGVTEMVESSGGRRVLWYSRSVPSPTQRVGICHGLHHLLTDLKTTKGMRECNLQIRELERVKRFEKDPVEVACDLFAGELLVPFDRLDSHAPDDLFPRSDEKQEVWRDQVDHLASTFKVPAGFIRWRLFDLIHLRRTNFFID